MKDKIILLGCGGHAKSVVDAIESKGEYEIAGFLDHVTHKNFEYRGYKVIGCDGDLQELFDSGIRYAFVCVGFLGKGTVRNRLYKCLKEIGFTIPIIIDPSAVLASDVRIGEGSFVGKRAVINANAFVGRMTIINTGAIIEHDCVIADFCHIAIAGVICGMVQLKENVFVGANATVIQGLCVGENAVIGAGSIVVKDIRENTKFVNRLVVG